MGTPIVPEVPDPSWSRRVRRRLHAWFTVHQRALPWRTDRDPYRIWVSEIMLQQTQVSRVVEYFDRFLKTFPTVSALAAADEAEVLRHWQGLGYYRRARDLHRAARLIVTEHEGKIPDDPVRFAQLPGIGRYTLGAILSQAFERRLPIVEANSQRLLCRLFGERGDPRSGPVRRWLWTVAEGLLPRSRVGDFNQALMELGALVCTPTDPHCPVCPLASECAANRLKLQAVIPPPTRPPRLVEEREVAVIVTRSDRLLLVQRPSVGRWANLWEFPHQAINATETTEAAATRLLRQTLGIDAELTGELLTLRHSVTRHRITLIGLEARYQSGEFLSSFYQRGEWVRPDQLVDYPISNPQRRLAEELLRPYRQRPLF